MIHASMVISCLLLQAGGPPCRRLAEIGIEQTRAAVERGLLTTLHVEKAVNSCLGLAVGQTSASSAICRAGRGVSATGGDICM
ncbi:MAG: hypothetical protein J3K34DRAFT_409734 [Monoraphidium minutum]|nr:MAG: hypothetical protein J3K34DRAFT_409734 [Monoraphidium minutum]